MSQMREVISCIPCCEINMFTLGGKKLPNKDRRGDQIPRDYFNFNFAR